MKTLSAMIAVATVATGTAGAAIAYVSTAPGSTAEPTISATPPTPQAQEKPPRVRLKVRFRPCKDGTRLEHGTCVRHVVRTVVEPAPVPVVVQAARPQAPSHHVHRSGEHEGDRPGKAAAGAAAHGEDEADHESDHESEHESGHESDEPEDGASDDVPGAHD